MLQGTSIGSLSSVDMLFKFIKPLVEEGEDDDDMDDEVRLCPPVIILICLLEPAKTTS